MSGYFTPGLVNISAPTGLEQIPCDTLATQGVAPESGYLTIAQLGGGGIGTVTDAGNSGTVTQSVAGIKTLNWTIAGTSEVFTMSGAVDGQVIGLFVTQGSGGSKTVAANGWTNVLWAAGTDPTLTTTSGHTDYLSFRYSSTLGKFVGNAILDLAA
jgi:hypothetical protein